MKTKNLVLATFFMLSTIQSNSQILKLGIFDITHNERYRYHDFIDITESALFEVEYKSMASILDTNFTQNDLEAYDGILFLLDIDFLQGIRTQSLPTKKMLLTIQRYAQNKNKLIGFAFPSIMHYPIHSITRQPVSKVLLFAPILQSINIPVISPTPFLNKLNDFLNVPIEARKGLYHTTLHSPSYRTYNIQPVISKQLYTLPIKPQNLSPAIQHTLPYGIYYFEPRKNNHIFITSYNLISSLGPSENYHFFPASFQLRKEIHSAVHQMMWDLHNLVLKKPINTPIPPLLIDTPKSKPKQLSEKQPLLDQTKIAWVHIDIFEKETIDAKEKQKRIIESIVKTGSNLYLWVSCNPHMILSDLAVDTNTKTGNRKKLNIILKSIAQFTQQLKKSCDTAKISPPKILFGYEIANNIRPHNKKLNVKHYTPIDIHGKTYPYCPKPLDKHFWQKDIIETTQRLLDKWKNPNISNGIKIAGIILDFEFYYCRSTKNFKQHMGFNIENLKKFDSTLPWTNNHATNIETLRKNKKTTAYFNFLEKEAEHIGQNIRKALPNMLIGCYNVNLSMGWFHTGMFKGLSTKKQPLPLLTFNAGFDMHQPWLQQNSIHAKHFSVLMLGKLKNIKDCHHYLKYINKHHHGRVWFNRWSNFGQRAEKNHNNIEKTHMLDKENEKFFKLIQKY
jgi:hypothetical protein